MIFVDSGAWFARFVPDDPNHRSIAEWFVANSEPLVTLDYCVDETLTLFVARKRPALAIAVGREFFDETIALLHFLTSDQIRRACILFRQRAASGWSFTDCTSKIVIDDLQVTTAVAIDHHFRQIGVEIVP